MSYNGGITMDLEWHKTFSRSSVHENVATSIDVDRHGNLYVTGYSFVPHSNYDFATIKYNNSGGYGWTNNPVQIYDNFFNNDKASSVKVNDTLVYVTGSSAMSPGGFYTQQYRQYEDGHIQLVWDNYFEPAFSNNERDQTEKASEILIDPSTGNVIVVAMRWGGLRTPKFAIRVYNPQGQILFTIDPQTDNLSLIDNSKEDLKQKNSAFSLEQNFPNPFNPSTLITFNIPESGDVELKIYDMSGKETMTLLNKYIEAGNHSVNFNATDLPSGVYHYKLSSGDFIQTRRMILVK